MKLNELYFGVRQHPLSYGSREDRNKMVTYNLFDLSKIKVSIAIYRTMDKGRRKELIDPLHFCFGDVWGRTEYEMIICPWPYADDEKVEDNGLKVDIFGMYVEPNRKYLMSLVEQVDVADCKKYLKEWKKRYKR